MKHSISIAFAALLLASTSPVYATDRTVDGLVKSSINPAVYYLAKDGKRYLFPNERVYKSWFSNFSGVKTISGATLASTPMGGNVTFRPATRLVKVVGDPKVYIVSSGRMLLWINSEATAKTLFGAHWNTLIDHVADVSDYSIGSPISTGSQYPSSVREQDANADIETSLASSSHGTVVIKISGAENIEGTFPTEICPWPLPAVPGMFLATKFNGYQLTIDEGPPNSVPQTLQLQGVRLTKPDGSSIFIPWSDKASMTRSNVITVDAVSTPENPNQTIHVHAIFDCERK